MGSRGGPRNRSRIGLLGGTFDPPHLGHLVVAEVARVTLELCEVQFVVAGQPWMREDFSKGEHRLSMVQLAAEDNPAFRVNRSEVDREGSTYTADTLEELTAEMPAAALYFLVGADAAAKMEDWRDVEKALELATFVAVARPGYEVERRGRIRGRLEWLEVPAIDISSTELRRRFGAGEAVRYQLPRTVEDYVRQQGLYGATPEP
ncbi:MAG: nicotinate-nucleotide adenylyltransferase [Actinomycetota bacterium]|nr:nicotinate-nucleotide adenylyltransferase [Actinomycetota bacterium]